MTHCPICALPLEINGGCAACRECGVFWATLGDGSVIKLPFHFSVCVACGNRIIDNPSWMNDHKCPPRHDASRGEREYTERGRNFSDRLADGFDLMHDIGGEG